MALWARPDRRSARAVVSDYGGLHRRSAIYSPSAPSSIEQVHEVVRRAAADGTPIRIRGAGHSMHGFAVPRDGELLVSTLNLSWFRFEDDGHVTIGSGAAVWDVDRMLRGYGFELLVCNDGGAAASSVGGYIAAGGIGPQTWLQGGFWETVKSLRLVTMTGEVRVVDRSDDLFPWMFGSMGQLGIVVEATLEIRSSRGGRPAKYPQGKTGRVKRSHPCWEKNLWYTLFVPEDAAERARQLLTAATDPLNGLWRAKESYSYFVRFRNFNPPLLYRRAESFVALGVWGELQDGDCVDLLPPLRLTERNLAALLKAEPELQRYVQSELLLDDFDFRQYFGEDLYAAFLSRKIAYDPSMLLTRDAVFRGLRG